MVKFAPETSVATLDRLPPKKSALPVRLSAPETVPPSTRNPPLAATVVAAANVPLTTFKLAPATIATVPAREGVLVASPSCRTPLLMEVKPAEVLLARSIRRPVPAFIKVPVGAKVPAPPKVKSYWLFTLTPLGAISPTRLMTRTVAVSSKATLSPAKKLVGAAPAVLAFSIQFKVPPRFTPVPASQVPSTTPLQRI